MRTTAARRPCGTTPPSGPATSPARRRPTPAMRWHQVPPGTRTSTYQLLDYQKVAGSFAQLTLDSITHADVDHPTVDPVPYTGIQYVDIPEFQNLGDQVSQQFAAAIAGTTSVDAALQQAQALADAVGKIYR